jgi:hypothetical protein
MLRLLRRHRLWPGLGLLAVLVTLFRPRIARAACGVQDPGGCVDGALYSFWYGIAGMGWALDRTLLLLAYQLDTFRWWLVEVAFSSAYQALVQIIDPLILPVATLAVILGSLASCCCRSSGGSAWSTCATRWSGRCWPRCS